MSIEPGQTLLHYRIVGKLGEGGMGEVWRAVDATLDRPVAIKVLPEAFSQDPERLARFEREAKLLASLSHANIATVHGLHEAGGSHFLAMELVEGEDLAARLARGPLSVSETLAVARQIAAALEAAHSKGVVHRDLKPANVVLTPDGQAKVLDFGLAKAAEPDAASASGSASKSPTLTSAGTVAGVLLGTAAYMSPEQARGKPVDRRADLWALGCVIYECLTGRQLFQGETVSDSLAAVLRKKPDWSQLPERTPPLVGLLLRRCLTRDPAHRLQDAGDARIELEQAIEDPQPDVLGVAPQAAEPAGRRIPPALLALAALALIVVAAGTAWVLKPRPNPETLHVGVPLPDRFESVGGFALSPDGETLAIAAQEKTTGDEPAVDAVYLRTWSESEFRKLPGTERVLWGEFSPGGDRALLIVGDELRPIFPVRVVPLDGGPATTAYEITQRGLLGWSSTFLSDDELLVVSQDGRELYRQPVSGGEPELAFGLEAGADRAFNGIAVPRFGGRYVVASTDIVLAGSPALYRVDLQDKQMTPLIEDAADPSILSSGHIAFLREDALWVAPFDLDRAELTGSARPVLSSFSGYAFDRSGRRLIYEAVDASRTGLAIVIVGASGEVVETLTDAPGRYVGIALSPDGRRLAYAFAHTAGEPRRIWVRDMASGLTRPVTPEGADAVDPRWMPDGRLVYTWDQGPERGELMVMKATPGATPEPLLPGSGEGRLIQNASSFSPDGRYALVNDFAPPAAGEPGIYLYDVGDGTSSRSFFASSMIEGGGRIRPDGRWVSYHTNGTGRFEVYLRPFVPEDPESAPIHPVTRQGGVGARWSPDGTTLYYAGLDDASTTLFAVTVETEPELRISAPRTVFTGVEGLGSLTPMPDGRFVLIQPKDGSGDRRPDLRLILNWRGGN